MQFSVSGYRPVNSLRRSAICIFLLGSLPAVLCYLFSHLERPAGQTLERLLPPPDGAEAGVVWTSGQTDQGDAAELQVNTSRSQAAGDGENKQWTGR